MKCCKGYRIRLDNYIKYSVNLVRYFYDGKEMVTQIEEKKNELPEDLGEDFSKAESFHRMHAAFERAISSLGKQARKTHYMNKWLS